MPPIVVALTAFRIDPVAVVVLVGAGALYAAGIVAAGRAGVHWSRRATLAFYGLGLGSYAWVSFGVLGAYSPELRWAFTTRIALLLFAVPALVTLGRPVALARAALAAAPFSVVERVLGSLPVRIVGNAMVAPLLALAAFLVFLTPVAGVLRESPVAEGAIGAAVPLIGLLMVLPIVEHGGLRTSLFLTAEFLLAFVELVMDAIPGILLRLNGTVLDHVTGAVAHAPAWFPNPLRDQQLSGDLLWFIAEIADVPVLIVLFVRWLRVDRTEAEEVRRPQRRGDGGAHPAALGGTAQRLTAGTLSA